MLNKLKKDKFTLIFFLIIVILGIFIRFHNFGEEGIQNDEMSIIPTGLLWFYDYPIYPGLSGQGEPALGNFFIGLGCMASGEDFSRVSETIPMFFPGREILIGEALTNGEIFCYLPLYIFGILFFIVITILAFSILNRKGALYATAFFAFWPFILESSRWIHLEIILYFFVALGILFLWEAYKKEKQTKKETLFFILSFAAFGLAFGTKFPAALYFLFAIFIILVKYKEETLKIISKIFNLKIIKEETKIQPLIKILIVSIISYIFFWLAGFKFSVKNFLAVLTKYRTVGGPEFSKFFNIKFFDTIYRLITQFNIIDVILFAFSLYILVRLISQKQKTKNEKFILYLAIFFWIAAISNTSMILTRVLITFIIGLILIMSLAFSNERYSLFNIFKIKNKKIFFAIFLIVYIVFSFGISLKISPYFSLRNKIICPASNDFCRPIQAGYFIKPTAEYLNSVLQDNETFMLKEGIIFFYLRREQGLLDWNFEQAFQKQVGRAPTIKEKIQYFKPNNRTIRYLLADPLIPENNNFPEEVKQIMKQYKPNKIIEINDIEGVWIYDLLNMLPR